MTAFLSQNIAASEPGRGDVLRVLEKAADWQLANPIAFDIISRQPADGKWEVIRVGWDGAVLLRRPCQPRTWPGGIPAPLIKLAGISRGHAAFCDIPEAARNAWLRETGFGPDAVREVGMLSGSIHGWEMGVLYHGMLALAEISPKDVYYNALETLAAVGGWRLGGRAYHADDHAAGYMYLACYEKKQDFTRICDVEARLDWILKHPSVQPMTIRQGQQRWTWCDALFMAPPVWARLARVTGNRAYLDFMDREWWATTAHLYSHEDELFYRDAKFFESREKNGERIFWSRGNGWVLAALPLVLDEMPDDYPTRAKYVELYKTMAERVVSLRPADGLWRSSLLHPDAFATPETSGTALFCHALAWGVREGHLDASHYRPIVLDIWGKLQTCVRADGLVGYIQQPSAAPGDAGATSTAPYGTGAFLLAGAGVYKMLTGDKK